MGYDHLENMQLVAVGDVPVLNLRHAMELTEACEGPYLRFNLQQNQVLQGLRSLVSGAEVLILRSAEAREATAEVLVKRRGYWHVFGVT